MTNYLNYPVNDLIADYKDGNIDELLNENEVDSFLDILRAKINFQEGNITEKEYNKLLK